MYNRCQIQPSSTDLEIPELEEDSDQDQFADLNNLITHHNSTFSEKGDQLENRDLIFIF